MEEELEDARSVAMQMVFQPGDRAIPLLPDGVRVDEIVGQVFAAQDLRTHAHDQHFLVIGAVEDADPPAFGQETRGAPEKIMLQLLGARVLEAEYLAALRIDAGHHVFDDAVLAGRVHALEDEQESVPVGRVQQALQRAQLLALLGEALLVLLVRRVVGPDARRPFLEPHLLAGAHPELVGVDLHRDGHGSSAGGVSTAGSTATSLPMLATPAILAGSNSTWVSPRHPLRGTSILVSPTENLMPRALRRGATSS